MDRCDPRSVFLYSLIVVSLFFHFSEIGWADERYLNNAEIIRYLSDREVKGTQKGTQWRQTFSGDGETYYEEVNGFRPSFGRWRAINDEYCSQWPPADNWTCYKVRAENHHVTFVPSQGDPWPAIRIEKN